MELYKNEGEKKEQSDLKQRLEKIEKSIEKLLTTQHTVNIHQLTLDHPVVESLTFRLDALDVKEISGALNLGNNYGVKVNKPEQSKKDTKFQSTDVPNQPISRTNIQTSSTIPIGKTVNKSTEPQDNMDDKPIQNKISNKTNQIPEQSLKQKNSSKQQPSTFPLNEPVKESGKTNTEDIKSLEKTNKKNIVDKKEILPSTIKTNLEENKISQKSVPIEENTTPSTPGLKETKKGFTFKF